MPYDPHLFVFNLDLAIREQLILKLEASPPIALATSVGPPGRAAGQKLSSDVIPPK